MLGVEHYEFPINRSKHLTTKMSNKSFYIPEGKFPPKQSIPSSNGLKITVSPTYHSLREQVGDTVIFEKGFREL